MSLYYHNIKIYTFVTVTLLFQKWVPQYQESNKGNWTLDACIHDNYESLEP